MKARLAFVLVAVLTLPCMIAGQAAPDTKPADIQPQSAEAPRSGSAQTPSPAAAGQPVSASNAAVLEDGTPVRMRIARTVSSADAKTGDTVDFEVLEDVFGAFSDNTPSSIGVAAGEHTVRLTKAGYKPWERKLRTSAGNIKIAAELEAESAPK
jgi:hypothetical protein